MQMIKNNISNNFTSIYFNHPTQVDTFLKQHKNGATAYFQQLLT